MQSAVAGPRVAGARLRDLGTEQRIRQHIDPRPCGPQRSTDAKSETAAVAVEIALQRGTGRRPCGRSQRAVRLIESRGERLVVPLHEFADVMRQRPAVSIQSQARERIPSEHAVESRDLDSRDLEAQPRRVDDDHGVTLDADAADLEVHERQLHLHALAVRIARQGRFSTAEALPLVQQMCDGLAAAHAEGVIHRDFKSSNVMLVPRPGDSGRASGRETRVAITDFGVARALEPVGAPEGLTGGAAVIGTPEYMAPEQVTGGAVSPATDAYALGVGIYQMVTGRPAFRGTDQASLSHAVLNDTPIPASELAPQTPPALDFLLARCLAKPPAERWQSISDVLFMLKWIAS